MENESAHGNRKFFQNLWASFSKTQTTNLLTRKRRAQRAILFSLPFALMGIFALVLLLHDGLLGGLNRQKAMGLLSAAIVCGGLIALIFGITAKKQALKAGTAKTDDEKPWLKRKDWADGRIASSSRKAVLLLWIFVAFWCAASAVISLVVVPPQLHQGNHAALIALIFPVIGLAMIFFALNTTRAWRKFGRSHFCNGRRSRRVRRRAGR